MQRLLDWAAKHPLVDPRRIVMTGNSGGGVIFTAYTAAVDQRIQAAIAYDCCLVPGLRDWGDGGHRFYPAKMWPFIENAIAEKQ